MQDAYLNEGGVIVQYQVEDPTVFGAFVPVSDPISREGELGDVRQRPAVTTTELLT